MARFLLSRSLGALVVLLALVATTFVLYKMSPVDPARVLVGVKASNSSYEAARQRLGLDDPLPVQYADYLGDVLRGDLRQSQTTGEPVTSDLREYLPATLELVTVAFLLAILMGTVFGLATAARWRGGSVIRAAMVGAAALPVFLTALLGLLWLYRSLHWVPSGGRIGTTTTNGPTGFLLIDTLLAGRPDLFGSALWHLALPATCLALGPAVAIGRVLRSSLTGTLRADWIRTARAKGLSERTVLRRHAIRNSLNPVLSIGGVQVAYLLGGTVVIESIFTWPGVGLYLSQAITNADYAAITGTTLVLGAAYVLANVAVDVLQAWADPRIRL
jgi:peptide/nickel transport system permease protein